MIHENIPFECGTHNEYRLPKETSSEKLQQWVQESIRLQESFSTTEKDDQNAKQILRDG